MAQDKFSIFRQTNYNNIKSNENITTRKPNYLDIKNSITVRPCLDKNSRIY